eukprot:gene6747-biopygen5031
MWRARCPRRDQARAEGRARCPRRGQKRTVGRARDLTGATGDLTRAMGDLTRAMGDLTRATGLLPLPARLRALGFARLAAPLAPAVRAFPAVLGSVL